MFYHVRPILNVAKGTGNNKATNFFCYTVKQSLANYRPAEHIGLLPSSVAYTPGYVWAIHAADELAQTQLSE